MKAEKTPIYLIIAATAGLTLGSMTAKADEKPNIIIILADDLGYGDVGCFGNKHFNTPNIDALAGDGIRFTDFHSNGAVCSPTRAALLTGRYQQRTGITGVVSAKRHRHTGLDLEETTFAEVLKTAGYTTALYGKWHVGYQPDYNPVRQGFDEFVGYVSGNVDYHAHLDQTGKEDWWKQDRLNPQKGYTTDLITDHGVEFIRRNKDRPFLLYLAHEAPHYPYQGRNDPPRYIRGKGRTKDPVTPEAYKEMIEVMDEGIGRIRKAVDDAGLSANTLIFFFSDNGPAGPGSAAQLRGKKGSIWEGGHRVPAVACWPGTIKAGRISHATAMGADLLPTMAAMAGVALPENLELDGVNLLPHLTREAPIASRPIFWGVKKMLAIRRGNNKLVTNESFTNPALYDLKADLGEKQNIAEQKPKLAQEFLKLLKEWHAEVNKGVKKRS
ncbi:MAG: sulfatase-like hydrolase/transferase [Pirellulales bacterium]|nr:sulfatase-like hydrolase/transferase [Pirellulales bacterium]